MLERFFFGGQEPSDHVAETGNVENGTGIGIMMVPWVFFKWKPCCRSCVCKNVTM